MHRLIPENWQKFFIQETKKNYFKPLSDFVNEAYLKSECFPPKNEIFRAYELCDVEKVKVVILGQDPYHNHGQANGLAFSVNESQVLPPSLKNIFKEIGLEYNTTALVNGNLENWAKQGVFLLNTTLTVEAHKAGSHQKHGWETFTDATIKIINDKTQNTVFLLWGAYAKKKAKLIDEKKHLILKSNHPSPLSANRGGWFGNQHFIETNKYLISLGKTAINWF